MRVGDIYKKPSFPVPTIVEITAIDNQWPQVVTFEHGGKEYFRTISEFLPEFRRVD